MKLVVDMHEWLRTRIAVSDLRSFVNDKSFALSLELIRDFGTVISGYGDIEATGVSCQAADAPIVSPGSGGILAATHISGVSKLVNYSYHRCRVATVGPIHLVCRRPRTTLVSLWKVRASKSKSKSKRMQKESAKLDFT